MNSSLSAASDRRPGIETTGAAFIVGVLLMAIPGAQSEASGSHEDATLVLDDFTTDDNQFSWYVVNDNVMGGRSEGNFSIEEGVLRFAGRTNTDGGGFSSIRTESVRLDLSDYSGIRLRVKGDGRRYTWRLATTARWRGQEIGYWADFDTRDGAWSTVDVPFSRFVPRFRGTRLDGPELDTGQITGMGLMIYDKLDGPFDVQIATIAAYPAAAPFSVRQFRGKNRVLLVSAPARTDENLVEVQADIAATRDEFEDRDLVLVILLDEGASTAGDTGISAPDAASARDDMAIERGRFALRLIGKDGSVKFSRKSAVAMSEIYEVVDAMPMRQREMSDR
jgi:NADH dehydrogenase [ubiquinone] 1 alpha subcomplex assembly factor 1